MSTIATSLPSELAAVVANIDPDAQTAGAKTSGWVDASEFMAFMAIFQAGTLGSSATLDGKIEQATDSSGTSAKDVTGAAITQLTQAGTDSDKQAVINLRTENLDVDGGFTHIRLSMTIGVATSDAAAILLGFGPRHGPASDHDAATVDEIVTP